MFILNGCHLLFEPEIGKLMVSHQHLLRSPPFAKKTTASDCCLNVALRLIQSRQLPGRIILLQLKSRNDTRWVTHFNPLAGPQLMLFNVHSIDFPINRCLFQLPSWYKISRNRTVQRIHSEHLKIVYALITTAFQKMNNIFETH